MKNGNHPDQGNLTAECKAHRGTGILPNGQSLKACLPSSVYGRYFPRRQKEEEFTELLEMYQHGKV